MVKPERRTRGDIAAAAAIVAIVALTAGLIWWTSDARATISRPAAAPVPYLTPAREVPAGLQQLSYYAFESALLKRDLLVLCRVKLDERWRPIVRKPR